MVTQKIRIKLRSHDHNLIDKSAEKIVKSVKATGAETGSHFLLAALQQVYVPPVYVHVSPSFPQIWSGPLATGVSLDESHTLRYISLVPGI
jgi:hypothetical protein